MNKQSNFFQRAVNAVVEGRSREAARFIARFEADHPTLRNSVTKR